MKTPTLFFVGENDPRVPLPQSIEMYRALAGNRRADAACMSRRARVISGARCAHLLLQGQRRARVVREAMRDGRAYVWEKAPK